LVSLHFFLEGEHRTTTMPPPGSDEKKPRSTRSSNNPKRSSRNSKISQKKKDNIEFEMTKRKGTLDRAHQRGGQRRKYKKIRVTPIDNTSLSLSSSSSSNTTPPSQSPHLQLKKPPPRSSSKPTSPGDSIDIKSQSPQQKYNEVTG